MLTPTEYIAITPTISSAPASSYAPAGLSAQRPPSLRESPDPSSRTLEPTQHDSHGFPLAITERLYTRLPRKGGYPQTRGELSLLPRIFRRHQHLPLGCQLWSPECSTNVSKSLYDIAGLFRTPPASLPDSTPLICVPTTRPTPHSERLAAPLLRTLGRYPFTAALYTTMCQNYYANLHTEHSQFSYTTLWHTFRNTYKSDNY